MSFCPVHRSTVPLYLLTEEALLNPRALEALLGALLDADADGIVTAQEGRAAFQN